MAQKLQKSNSMMNIKAYTTRALKLLIETYLSNQTHIAKAKATSIRGKVNPDGFIEVLSGGFKCFGRESIEVAIPIEIDLSLSQNQGFSIYFWFIASKPFPSSKTASPSFIFKKGNTVDQCTPTIGLTSNGSSLFFQLTTTKRKRELFYSNKRIDHGHFYSVSVTFGINYEEETTDICLYFDGKLDAHTTIPGEPVHNQGNIYLGKPDETSNGFKGTIADVILVPRVLSDKEVRSVFDCGLENLIRSKGISLDTSGIFKELFERYKLANKYAMYTGKTMFSVDNLNLSNRKMKEVVKNYDAEEKKNDISLPVLKPNVLDEDMIGKMAHFLKNEDNDVLTRKIIENARFINTVLYLANKGEDNFEVERIVNIFKVLNETLHFKLEELFIVELGTILNAIIVEKKEGKGAKKTRVYYLTLSKFFKHLKRSLQALEDLQRKEDEEKAKFFTRRVKMLRVKSFYNNRNGMRQSESVVSFLNKDKFGFIQCIAEHERFLHRGQHLKNFIDAQAEESLVDYQSSFVLKSIYEKQKNLPGENPEFPQAKIIKTSVEDTNEVNSSEESVTKPEVDPELVSLVRRYIGLVFDDALLRAEVNENIVKYEEDADCIQRGIYSRREAEIRRIENEKRLGEMALKKAEENDKEAVTEPKAVEKNDYDPVIPENWTEGNFEVVINHCYNCHKHETTTKHYEYYFINKFNEIGEGISTLFPNSVIVGNLDQQDYLGNFDVYLRGTGLPGDEKGRYFIYRKFNTLKFPSVHDVLDKLIALAIMYGNTINIESAQLDEIRANTSRLAITHELPAALSEEGEKRRQMLINSKREKLKIDPEYTKLFCIHWGCGATFVENENKGECCQYHPGLWQFGSFNRYWPSCWTCCEGAWDSKGCKMRHHSGVILDQRLHLCLNHGLVNPYTGKPDSACGAYYTDKSDEGCLYHSGHIKKGSWTCCGEEKEKKGCVTGKHCTEDYPHEKAQLYFYPKAAFNPGLQYLKDSEKKNPHVADLICNCDYFKKAKVYPNIKEIVEQRKKKQRDNKTAKRCCFNWGCEKEYTEQENTPKSCTCHPGKWDHGSSGSTMVNYIAEISSSSVESKKKAILWKPHWSCCGEDWAAKGCTQTKHHGPLEADVAKYEKKYKWPDERLKLMFSKVTGDRWKEYLRQFQYDEAKVRSKCKLFYKSQSHKVQLSDIPKLCDKLRLYLILVQDNPEWTMKYYDVIYQKNTIQLFTGSDGMCDMEKFIQWWILPYEDIYNILNPPPKKKDVQKKEEPSK